MPDIESGVAEVLSVLLGRNVPSGGNVGKDSCPAWDSMKHVEIVMALEARFGISFAPGDIPLLVGQAELVRKIRELTAATSVGRHNG